MPCAFHWLRTRARATPLLIPATPQTEEGHSALHDSTRTVFGGRLLPLMMRLTLGDQPAPNPSTGGEWAPVHAAATSAGAAFPEVRREASAALTALLQKGASKVAASAILTETERFALTCALGAGLTNIGGTSRGGAVPCARRAVRAARARITARAL